MCGYKIFSSPENGVLYALYMFTKRLHDILSTRFITQKLKKLVRKLSASAYPGVYRENLPLLRVARYTK